MTVATTAPPLLDMQGIVKRFGKVPALSEATLTIGPGEVHALIGQNGAGKSTMIKVLTGYYDRDAGEVLFEGKPFSASSPNEAQRLGISTIYQEINLVPLRSVTENICLGRNFKRFGFLDWRAMHKEARRLLGYFGIDIDVRRPLGEFSTATQQMVAIARAIGFSARLVIMDEPTSSLDEREVETLLSVIRKLKADGVSIIYVSHKLDELYAVCDRVTIMRDGRTVRSGAMSDIDKTQLVSLMLGRDIAKAEGQTTAFGGQTSAAGNCCSTRRISRRNTRCATPASACGAARLSASRVCSARAAQKPRGSCSAWTGCSRAPCRSTGNPTRPRAPPTRWRPAWVFAARTARPKASCPR
jgi:galactofuranose transport system ATP-binding protein